MGERMQERGPRGMSLLEMAALVSWKARQRLRHLGGGLGGYAWLQRRGDGWAARWAARLPEHAAPTALAEWLARPTGGRFWLEPETAPAWARATCGADDVALADASSAGVFDLLGSGPVPLGERPTWRRDLYSGVEWPLAAAHRLRIVRGDGSDVRTVWELSRAYHFPALARAYWSRGEPRYREAFVRHVESWLAHNPLGRGPNWASPMDAGLRAANWVVGTLLFAPAPEIPRAFWQRLLANLYATGLFLERHLEWHPVYRGNHYVSNGVGLAYLGTLFRDSHAGARWLRVGARILMGELQRQVRPDGVSFEASLAYHRLVTEFFAFGGELLRRNLPGTPMAAYDERLRAMYRFLAAYLPPGGEAPMLGDADDGRLHALAARGLREPRRHALGLPAGYGPAEPPGPAAFPQGGFFVLRGGADHAVVRCGPVGLNGAGSHDHNDQLALELVLAGRRVLADSGTYAYTRDLAARHAFRATAAHSVLQLGDEEPNPIRPERPWRVLADRTRAECVRWEVGAEPQLFVGRHFGYRHRASHAVCMRSVRLWAGEGRCEIRDEVEGRGREPLTWRLHLEGPAAEIEHRAEGRLRLALPGEPSVRLEVRFPPELRPLLTTSWASERYGQRRLRPCLQLSGECALPAVIEARFTALPGAEAPTREDAAAAHPAAAPVGDASAR